MINLLYQSISWSLYMFYVNIFTRGLMVAFQYVGVSISVQRDIFDKFFSHYQRWKTSLCFPIFRWNNISIDSIHRNTNRNSGIPCKPVQLMTRCSPIVILLSVGNQMAPFQMGSVTDPERKPSTVITHICGLSLSFPASLDWMNLSTYCSYDVVKQKGIVVLINSRSY